MKANRLELHNLIDYWCNLHEEEKGYSLSGFEAKLSEFEENKDSRTLLIDLYNYLYDRD